MIKTYQVRRPSLVGATWRDRGEPVPEAHLWRLREGMVRSGRLIQVEMSEADFADAVAKYCPADGEKIYAKLGLGQLELPGSRGGKARGKRTVLLSAPTPIGD